MKITRMTRTMSTKGVMLMPVMTWRSSEKLRMNSAFRGMPAPEIVPGLVLEVG